MKLSKDEIFFIFVWTILLIFCLYTSCYPLEAKLCQFFLLSLCEFCFHASFTYCLHTRLLSRDGLTHLSFTMASSLFCVQSEPVQVCVRGHSEGIRGRPCETAQVHAVRIKLMWCQLFLKMMLKFSDGTFSTRWQHWRSSLVWSTGHKQSTAAL